MQNKIKRKTLGYVLLASMGLANAGCEKLNQAGNLPVLEAIPASYGELVSVMQHPDDRYVVVLWFEQPEDKSIVAVRVNFAHGNIGARIVEFPRG